MTIELKIKIKSLAAEAKIIRAEERKLRNSIENDNIKISGEIRLNMNGVDLDSLSDVQKARLERRLQKVKARDSLANHRRQHVGRHSRHSQLAYAFLRDVPLRRVEGENSRKPDWSIVEKEAIRFGGGDSREVKQRFEEWKQAAA